MINFKQYIRKILITALIVIVCFFLQTNIFSRFQLAKVTPNILLCVVSSFGFMNGQKKGLIVGFFCGLLVDIYMGYYLGIMAFIYMIIGFINGFFKRLFFGDDLKLPLVLIGASDLIYGVLVYVFLFLTRNQYNFKFYFSYIMIPELVYTVLVSIFGYYAILKITSLIDKLDKRGSRRLDGTF